MKKTIFTLIIISIVIFVSFLFLSGNDNSKTDTNTTTSTTTTTDSNDNSVDEEFSKKGAVDAVTTILKELNVAPDGKLTDEERMSELSSDSYDKTKVFTESGWNKIHLSDFMATDPRGEILSGQSLLSVIHTIKETGNTEITPTDIDYSGVVLFDEETKTAYVPVDLYTNTPTNLSFEMVYINGHWYLQPYTLISQIAIRTMEQSAIASTPEGQSVLTSTESSSTDETTSSSNS